jgi:hypothetical protein
METDLMNVTKPFHGNGLGDRNETSYGNGLNDRNETISCEPSLTLHGFGILDPSYTVVSRWPCPIFPFKFLEST